MPIAKEILKRLVPETVKRRLRDRFAPPADYRKDAYAQEGEDLIFISLFGLDAHPSRRGFYVDVGAHHPLRMSNTHLLYLRGWRGINIDPKPGAMKLFDELRPGDINLELGVSAAGAPLRYYSFTEPLLNGFDADTAKQRDGYMGHKIQSVTEIQTMTLAEVLDKHLPPGQSIDLLSIDVEGLDLEVLQSNDWSKYRPSVLAIEDSELLSLAETGSSQIVRFMAQYGYAPYCKTPLTTFFAQRDEAILRPFGMRLRKYDSERSPIPAG